MWTCASAIWEKIEKHVATLYEKYKWDIIVTGHSLGAGTSTLLAILMRTGVFFFFFLERRLLSPENVARACVTWIAFFFKYRIGYP
jgi:hypothetical protein